MESVLVINIRIKIDEIIDEYLKMFAKEYFIDVGCHQKVVYSVTLRLD